MAKKAYSKSFGAVSAPSGSGGAFGVMRRSGAGNFGPATRGGMRPASRFAAPATQGSARLSALNKPMGSPFKPGMSMNPGVKRSGPPSAPASKSRMQRKYGK